MVTLMQAAQNTNGTDCISKYENKSSVIQINFSLSKEIYIYKTYIKYVHVCTYLYICMLGKKMQMIWNYVLQSPYKEKS